MSSISLLKPSKQYSLVSSNTKYTKLEKENKKLKTANKILQAKNMILEQNCQDHTSYHERQAMTHQLEIDLAGAPIKNLQIKIATLKQVNNQLTNTRNALNRRIEDYEQKHTELLEIHRDYNQQLKQTRKQIKILQGENSAITDELNTLKYTEIAWKDRQIADLHYELEKAHERLQRKTRRKAETALPHHAMKIEVSETIKTTRLSQSSLCYSSDSSGKPLFYNRRSNKSPTPSASSVSTAPIKTRRKRSKNKKRRNVHFHLSHTPETAVSSSSYEKSDMEEDHELYSENHKRWQEEDGWAFWEYVAPVGAQRLMKEEDMKHLSVDGTVDSNRADALDLGDLSDTFPDADTVSSRRSISSTVPTPNYGYYHISEEIETDHKK